jgi:hypothetical protein
MQDGTYRHLYQGAIVPEEADADHVKLLAEDGAIGNGEPTVEPDTASAGETESPVKPAGNASHEAWATYAVQSGQTTEEEAKGLTRDELRELYG